MTLFDILTEITTGKKDITDDPLFEKTYSQYMINRFLAMNKSTLAMANLLNGFGDITNKNHFLLLMKSFPKKKVWFSYKKKEKAPDKNSVNIISDYFRISNKDAVDIFKILSPEQLNNISSRFGGKYNAKRRSGSRN